MKHAKSWPFLLLLLPLATAAWGQSGFDGSGNRLVDQPAGRSTPKLDLNDDGSPILKNMGTEISLLRIDGRPESSLAAFSGGEVHDARIAGDGCNADGRLLGVSTRGYIDGASDRTLGGVFTLANDGKSHGDADAGDEAESRTDDNRRHATIVEFDPYRDGGAVVRRDDRPDAGPRREPATIPDPTDPTKLIAGTGRTRTYVYHQLTSFDGDPTQIDKWPLLSESGNRILFAAGGKPKRVYVLDPDGSDLREIDRNDAGRRLDLDISADGSRAVSNDGSLIRMIRTDGSGGRDLYRQAGDIRNLRISGDGERVFFMLYRRAERGVYGIGADGRGRRRIVSPAQVGAVLGVPEDDVTIFGANGAALGVSHDGSRLVFAAENKAWGIVPAGKSIFTANGDGSNLRRILGPFKTIYAMGLSSNGARIGYIAAPAGESEFGAVIDYDGTSGRRLAEVNQMRPGGGSTPTRPLHLSTDGSMILLGDHSILFACDGRGAASLTTPGGSKMLGAGLYWGWPAGDMRRCVFLMTDDARRGQLAMLTIDPVDPGPAPRLEKPEFFPAEMARATEEWIGVQASARPAPQTGALGVSCSFYRDGILSSHFRTPTLSDNGSSDDGDAGDGRYGAKYIRPFSDCPPGRFTVRVKADVRDARNFAHALALEFGDLGVFDLDEGPLPPTLPPIADLEIGANSLLGAVKHAGTGEPVTGASVKLQGTGLETTTDANGDYALSEAPDRESMLIVSKEGYEASTRDVVVAGEDESVTPTIELTPIGARRTVGEHEARVDAPGGASLLINEGTFPPGTDVTVTAFPEMTFTSEPPHQDGLVMMPLGSAHFSAEGLVPRKPVVALIPLDTSLPPGTPLAVFRMSDDTYRWEASESIAIVQEDGRTAGVFLDRFSYITTVRDGYQVIRTIGRTERIIPIAGRAERVAAEALDNCGEVSLSPSVTLEPPTEKIVITTEAAVTSSAEMTFFDFAKLEGSLQHKIGREVPPARFPGSAKLSGKFEKATVYVSLVMPVDIQLVKFKARRLRISDNPDFRNGVLVVEGPVWNVEVLETREWEGTVNVDSPPVYWRIRPEYVPCPHESATGDLTLAQTRAAVTRALAEVGWPTPEGVGVVDQASLEAVLGFSAPWLVEAVSELGGCHASITVISGEEHPGGEERLRAGGFEGPSDFRGHRSFESFTDLGPGDDCRVDTTLLWMQRGVLVMVSVRAGTAESSLNQRRRAAEALESAIADAK